MVETIPDRRGHGDVTDRAGCFGITDDGAAFEFFELPGYTDDIILEVNITYC